MTIYLVYENQAVDDGPYGVQYEERLVGAFSTAEKAETYYSGPTRRVVEIGLDEWEIADRCTNAFQDGWDRGKASR